MNSLDAARAVLHSRPDITALLASTEIITPDSYLGKSRPMQVGMPIVRIETSVELQHVKFNSYILFSQINKI